MKFFESKSIADGKPIKLSYEDLGTGKPIVFTYCEPLQHDRWNHKLCPLPLQNFRRIAYDCRGIGKSDCPASNHGTLADDLKGVLDQLNLKNLTLGGIQWAVEKLPAMLSNMAPRKLKN
jgi:non-heme chloroperoxidase